MDLTLETVSKILDLSAGLTVKKNTLMKKTNMLFRRLEVREKIEKKDYAFPKNNKEHLECISDKPSLWVSNNDAYPLPTYETAGYLVAETDGNYYYRRIL